MGYKKLLICVRYDSWIPIMKDEDRDEMAIWEDKDELKKFMDSNILCQHSEVLVLDFFTGDVDYQP